MVQVYSRYIRNRVIIGRASFEGEGAGKFVPPLWLNSKLNTAHYTHARLAINE